MKLTKEQISNPLWRVLRKHLEARLASLRAQNDTTQSIEKTEHLRGRIAEVQALLEIETESKNIEVPEQF